MHGKLFFTAALLALCGTAAFAQNLPRMVLVPLENRAGTQYAYDVETLGELLANFISETRRLNVIDRFEMDASMAAQGRKMDDWADNAKTAEMGRALNAQYIVRGTVSRLGDNLLVSARILDIATAELRSSTNTQLEHMNEAYSKMNSMAQILIYNLGLPAQPAQTAQPVEPEQPQRPARAERQPREPRQPGIVEPEADRAARLNTLGVSVGSSFSDPWLMITIHGTYAPLRHLFLEAGCDFGFISDATHEDMENYYSVYLFTHAGFFNQKGRDGWYIGAGGGYMFGEYAFAWGKTPLSVFAADLIVGLNVAGFVDMSYTIRTNFVSLSHKLSIGYTYRFK